MTEAAVRSEPHDEISPLLPRGRWLFMDLTRLTRALFIGVGTCLFSPSFTTNPENKSFQKGRVVVEGRGGGWEVEEGEEEEEKR